MHSVTSNLGALGRNATLDGMHFKEALSVCFNLKMLHALQNWSRAETPIRTWSDPDLVEVPVEPWWLNPVVLPRRPWVQESTEALGRAAERGGARDGQ